MMKQYYRIIINLFVFFSVFTSLTAMGSKDDPIENEALSLTGIIRITGSSPNIHVTLKTQEGISFFLIGEKADELGSHHQLQKVKIVYKQLSPQKPGKPAEIDVLSYEIIN
ncbi:hypothetical protein [Spirochaeta isovalerica]|uniref:Uncharacterized protein n=1 Tax=Spirochaeta isovalerica TaxID=150 RepID=A0A841R564_9SPIO|nr:hypothetical protein [Spirochaeta isovalerica]MBB6478953.1 hypothetical protein [Spirochaeta isovalerica]